MLQRFASDAKRKTKFDLIAVQKGALLLNIDSQGAQCGGHGNFLASAVGWIHQRTAHRNTWGDSVLTFILEQAGARCLAEVKDVTLEEDGTALFPDAPTLRGIKHLEGLSRAAAQGFACCVLFVVQFSPQPPSRPTGARTLLSQTPCAPHGRRSTRTGLRLRRPTPESMVLRAPVPVTGL